MAILTKIKSKITAIRRAWNSASEEKITMSRIMELFSSSYNAELGGDLGEIVFFTCLKILSESVGKIPCYLMDEDKRRINNHDTMWFLSVKPNEYMTPVQFFAGLEFWRNYYGNAYVYVSRNVAGKIDGLYPLDPRRVQIWINNTEKFTARKFYYFYTDDRTGKSYYFEPDDVLHFKSWITDDSGLAGKSVREILATSFAGAKSSTKFLNDLYSKGLIASAVVKYTGDLKRESQDRLLDEIIAQAEDKGRRMITIFRCSCAATRNSKPMLFKNSSAPAFIQSTNRVGCLTASLATAAMSVLSTARSSSCKILVRRMKERRRMMTSKFSQPIPIEIADGKYTVEWGADDFYLLFYGRLLDAQKIALRDGDKDDEAHVLANLIVWLLTRLEVLGYDEKARADMFNEINDIHRSLGMIQGGD